VSSGAREGGREGGMEGGCVWRRKKIQFETIRCDYPQSSGAIISNSERARAKNNQPAGT
jgi:hypothetical protein